MVWNFAMPPENTNFWNTRKQIITHGAIRLHVISPKFPQ